MIAQKQIKKLTIREVRMRAARHGILSVSALAETIGCSRQAIYFALERPHRFSNVFAKLNEVIE
jgi:hypothetical protein